MQTISTTNETHRLNGISCTQHYFEVPLNYQESRGRQITIFARELVGTERSSAELPYLVYLQGGPGFQSPRPESASGWLKRALKDYRVLLLDQRGTGLSSPVTHQTLALLPTPEDQAEYLRHFRSDNIVRDCESIRKLLGARPWTVLGQSYGGFCSVAYLSLAPEGLAGAIIAGGLPPLVDEPDHVYRATYRQVLAKNELYYQRYPNDAQLVRKIVEHLRSTEVRLSNGETLTPRRFLQIGINLGFRLGGRSLDAIHYLLEGAFLHTSSESELSYAFLRGVENSVDFNTNPIYTLLHEAIYCQKKASNWSAHRILKEYPEFGLDHNPVYFTGEMIYPWMCQDYSCLRSLEKTAEILAQYTDWPELYNVETLRKNTVPCAAAVYHDDMYVDRELSLQTAKNIQGIKLWITNEHEHDAIRVDGEAVLDRLLGMLK